MVLERPYETLGLNPDWVCARQASFYTVLLLQLGDDGAGWKPLCLRSFVWAATEDESNKPHASLYFSSVSPCANGSIGRPGIWI